MKEQEFNKDKVVMLYVMLCLGFVVLTYMWMTLPPYMDCTVTTKDGVSLTGNCTYITAYRNNASMFKMYWALDNYNMFTDNKTLPCPETTTSTTSTPTTLVCPTPTQCVIPDCVCTCPECTKCPECKFELDSKQIDWLINDCSINRGSPGYQAGSDDSCDMVREFLEVPGRPKFKSRASMSGFTKVTNNQYCFLDQGGYFEINRSTRTFNNSLGEELERKMWGWNDDNCHSSSIRINKL